MAGARIAKPRHHRLEHRTREFIRRLAEKCDDDEILFMAGSIAESLKWFTRQRFEVQEIECRAMGAPACVFEIKKKRLLPL